MHKQEDAVYVDPGLMEYAVQIVAATRRPQEFGVPEVAKYLAYGASPRASINLILAGRALAFLRGRDYIVSNDVSDLAGDVLRHRLVLSYEALADGVTADAVITRVMGAVPRPARPMSDPRLQGTGPSAPVAATPPAAEQPRAEGWRTA